MIYLSSFCLSDEKVKNPNIYPYNVFRGKDAEPFVMSILWERIIVYNLKKGADTVWERMKMAEEINQMARFLGCQFVIATHSPFMLGILNAKIYNLDTMCYEVQKWTELPNVRYFYEFFKGKESEFY